MDVKDNILFTLPYDAAKYQEVISIADMNPNPNPNPNPDPDPRCSHSQSSLQTWLRSLMVNYPDLDLDLELLNPVIYLIGDLTEIGERGINLSGGQKARVAFCRALYHASETPLFVLDDITSALDAHVGRNILENAVLGYLSKKSRVVALNANYLLLPHADRVIVMEENIIIASGTPSEVLPRFEWLQTKGEENLEANGGEGEDNETNVTEGGSVIPGEAGSIVQDQDQEGVKGKALMSQEARGSGIMSLSTYISYFEYAGLCGGDLNFTIVLVTITLAEMVRIGADWWLAEWSAGTMITGKSTNWWVASYMLWTVGVGVFGLIRVLIFKENGGLGLLPRAT